MATQITTNLIDDLDGGPADKTVVFAYEGKTYEIDLAAKNINAFEEALEPYFAAARPRDGEPAQRLSRSARRRQMLAIRTWARANGYQVSDRGRLPTAVVEAFRAAQ